LKEADLGKELRSILKLPSAVEDQKLIGIYVTCLSCNKRILASELSISRIVQESANADTFIKKANSFVYRRSTLHEERCPWGIPTVKTNAVRAAEKELALVPVARRRREWMLRSQMLQLAKDN
jgi:hypothetical protein